MGTNSGGSVTKVPDLIRKGKNGMLKLLRFLVRTNLLGEIVKEKEIGASFSAAPQTAEVLATVCDKCLVNRRKVLNLYSKVF